MIRKYHNHKPQTTPWHREEEPLKPERRDIRFRALTETEKLTFLNEDR